MTIKENPDNNFGGLVLNIKYLKKCYIICNKVNFISFLDQKKGKELQKIYKKIPEKGTINDTISKLLISFYCYDGFIIKINNELKKNYNRDWYSFQVKYFKNMGYGEVTLDSYLPSFVMTIAVISRGIIRGVGKRKKLSLAIHKINRDGEL